MDPIPFRSYTLVGDERVLTYEHWCISGTKLHRVDGPAWRGWQIVNGAAVLMYEEWWLEGKLHRVDGPAWQKWTIVNGVTVKIREDWWLEGRPVDPYASPCVRQLTATHLQRCGLLIWPGLMNLIGEYLG